MLDALRTPLSYLNPARTILRNPVVMKELRGRMRGARAFVVLSIYLSLVIFFMAIAYGTQTVETSNVAAEIDGGEIGQLLFAVVVYVELFLVMFITPTVTTNAISGEHERQTYDLLRTTLLPERSLVAGKLFSALAYVFLLLLATIPLQSIALVFGGVAIDEIIVMQVILLMTALFFGTVGVYFSATTRRTLRANMLTYTAIMVFIIFPFLVWLIASPILADSQRTGEDLPTLLFFGFFICLNPVLAMFFTQDIMQTEQARFLFEAQLDNGTSLTLPLPWIVFTVFYIILAAVIFMVTTRRLKKIDSY